MIDKWFVNDIETALKVQGKAVVTDATTCMITLTYSKTYHAMKLLQNFISKKTALIPLL